MYKISYFNSPDCPKYDIIDIQLLQGANAAITTTFDNSLSN